jgi:leader peptidase (prepilin peptidase)/N-methyltransferase
LLKAGALRDVTTEVMGLRVIGAVLAGALGGAFASFAAVLLDRVPRGESLGGRSHCSCGQQIRAVENVPVLSYVRLRGRAHCCGARIPVWFAVVELLGVGLGAGIFLLLSA